MLGMFGRKDLKAKLFYVGLIKMCVGRFLFFLSQMLNQRTNVVLAYNVFGLGVVALSKNLKLTTTLDRAITQNPCYVPLKLER